MNKIKNSFGVFLAVTLLPSIAIAAPALDDVGSVESGFNQFLTNTTATVNAAVNSAAVQADVTLLWNFFAVLLVIWTMYLYAFKKGTIVDILSTAILIMIVKVLMGQFTVLTSAIWSAANGFAGDVQLALLGSSDLFFAPAFISNVVNSITFSSAGIFSPLTAVLSAIDIVIVGAVSLVLSALAYFATIWGFWGYSIAKLIGLLFVPFLLYERLSWLFDGWLRFFFSFVFYAVVARLNLALLALAFAAFFGVTPSLGGQPAITLAPITALSQVFGLLVFALVGILATLSTGSFVATIVGGSASSTGIGVMLSRGAGKLAGKALGG